jgi:hypothetical protein
MLTFFAPGTPKGQPRVRAFARGRHAGVYDEQWVPLPDYEAKYLVSNFGAVKRADGNPKAVRTSKNGYTRVELCLDGIEKTILVHRAVAMAFVPGFQAGLHVNHINGVKSDNRASNLEWVTPKENTKHALLTGLAPTGKRNGAYTHRHLRQGEANGRAKLTASDLNTIREMRSNSATLRVIAARFGVCVQTISNVINNNTWSHEDATTIP